MPFPSGRARAAALVACVGLSAPLAAGSDAFAQAKKPTPAPPAQAQPAPGSPAPAQQPQGPVKVELKATRAEWTKVCGKDQGNNKEVCYTTRDFSTDPGQQQVPPIALAVYDVKGDDTRIVRLLMPVGLLLKPGFRVSVDKGPQIDGAFELCMPNGCFAETKIKGIAVDQLKKGTVMNVAVKNAVNIEVDFSMPLAGFGKAFDGPPIDPKVLQAQQEELQKQLEAKAKQQRQVLEQQGGATAPAPASAGVPPAAPAK